MKATYMGNRNKYDKGKRFVDIECNRKERRKLEVVIRLMNKREWGICSEIETGWARCDLEDRDEFLSFMCDWNECKKLATEEIRGIKRKNACNMY